MNIINETVIWRIVQMHFSIQSNLLFGIHNKHEIHIQYDGGLEKHLSYVKLGLVER